MTDVQSVSNTNASVTIFDSISVVCIGSSWRLIERRFSDKAMTLVVSHRTRRVGRLSQPAQLQTQHTWNDIEPVIAVRWLMRAASVWLQCRTPRVSRSQYITQIESHNRRRTAYQPAQCLTWTYRPIHRDAGPDWDHADDCSCNQPADIFSPCWKLVTIVLQMNAFDAREEQHKLHNDTTHHIVTIHSYHVCWVLILTHLQTPVCLPGLSLPLATWKSFTHHKNTVCLSVFLKCSTDYVEVLPVTLCCITDAHRLFSNRPPHLLSSNSANFFYFTISLFYCLLTNFCIFMVTVGTQNLQEQNHFNFKQRQLLIRKLKNLLLKPHIWSQLSYDLHTYISISLSIVSMRSVVTTASELSAAMHLKYQ